MFRGYHINLEKVTKENTDYRRVLYTGKGSQLVLMCILPRDEIGFEIHKENDQFFRFEFGTGKVTVDGTEYEVHDGDSIIVPMGAKHNVCNLSDSEALRFYTIYSPAHHRDGLIHKTKIEALHDEEEFNGITSE